MDRERLHHENVLPPYRVLGKLFAADPEIARAALARRAESTPVNERFIEIALASLLAIATPDAEDIALELIARDARGALLVASALTSVGTTLASQQQVLRVLLATDHPQVHTMLLNAARSFEAGSEPLILEMLGAAPIESEAEVADAAMGLLATSEVVPWASLSRDNRAEFLQRLLSTPRLEGYHLGELMQRQITIDASVALDFLQRRIAAGDHAQGDYETLPFLDSVPLDFRGSPNLRDLIGQQIGWLLGDTTWSRHHEGMQLLEKLFGGYGPETLAVVLDLIRSQDPQRVELARGILNNAPRDFVVREPAFVADALEASTHLPQELVRYVVAGLHGSAVYGGRSRSVGVDDPAEVDLRDKAHAVARRHPDGSTLRTFYEDVAKYATARIVSEREEDATLREPREW